MRFLAAQHLRRPSDIRMVREAGQRIECRVFTIWWKRRVADSATSAPTVPDQARVCVIASGAAVGIAVRRNRAKRRLREIFRRHQDRVPRACDLLLIARASALTTSMPELEKRFLEACQRINASGVPNA
jgi:ribonuclease P protein component